MGDKHITGPDDEALVCAAQTGDLDAFSELYQRYFATIYRYIMVRIQDELAAEDLAEKVFLNVFQKLDSYQDRGCLFSTYLYQVTRNIIIDHYRKKDRSVPLDDSFPESMETRDMDQQIIQRERLRMIRSALAELPSDYQEVIRLRILLELPTETVASWMGRSPGAVRILLHRALKTLRLQVGEIGENQAAEDCQ